MDVDDTHHANELSPVLLTELQQGVSQHCPAIDPQFLDDFFAQLDPPYFESFALADIALHVTLLAEVNPEHPVQVRIRPLDEGRAEIIIVAYDLFGEFSLITGLMAAYQLNIREGQVFSYQSGPGQTTPWGHTDGGMIVDVFTVGSSEASPFDDEAQAQFVSDLSDLIQRLRKGEVQPARDQLNHRLINAFRVTQPALTAGLASIDIDIDNESSPDWTIVHLTADDSPGFLYTLSNALAMRHMYIHGVHIQSHANKVQDRLEIGWRRGGKIFVIGNWRPPLVVAHGAGGFALVRVVHVHQVDIGRKIQLVAAQFAHANDTKPAGTLLTALIHEHGPAMLGIQCLPAVIDPGLHDGIGQRGQRCGGGFDIREVVEVLSPDAHQVAVGEGTQGIGNLALCFTVLILELLLQFGSECFRGWRGFVDSVFKQPREPIRMTAEHGAQKRGFGKDRQGIGNVFGMLAPLVPKRVGRLTDIQVMQQVVHGPHGLSRPEQAIGKAGQEIGGGRIRKTLVQGPDVRDDLRMCIKCRNRRNHVV